MEHNRQNFLSFWTIFCPFTPCPTPHPPFNNPKNQNFEKMKKTPGDIIILHKCPINDDHMIVCHKWRSYVSWDINCNRQIFCHLGPFFALLPPPNSSKNENIKKTRKTEKKKWRKHLEISSFYAHVPKIMIICSTVPEIYVCDKCNCYFFFWAIFCPFTSLTAQKMKISKKWKNTQEISSFYTTVSKIMIIGYTAPEIWHVTHAILIFHFGLFFAFLPP